ncbi:MAG: hypothetical protein IT378_24880 [Sandaracinaceae bacterium]|nr:hypothetical protein [Sandaracinaceae bacterium]
MTTLAGASSLLSLLADPTRVRLLALCAKSELSVAELVQNHRAAAVPRVDAPRQAA